MRLKNQIQKPFLISIILFPILLIILFNICAYVYSYQQGKSDLLRASKKLENDIANILNLEQDAEEFINIIRSGLSTDNIELLIIDEDILFPSELNDSFLSKEIIDKININNDELTSFNVNSSFYHYIKIEHNLSNFKGDIFYVSRGYINENFLVTINVILILCSSLLIVIFLIISNKIAKNISKPLEKISKTLPNVTQDEVIIFDTKTETLEINLLSDEINKMSKRICSSNKIQKEFLQNVSHEIRTPLTNIKGYNEALKHNLFDNKKIYEVIESESDKINDYIEKFLTISKLETLNYVLEESDVNVLIKELLDKLSVVATNNKKNINYNLKDKIKVNINKELFEQVINNIVINAIKYSKKNIDINIGVVNNNCIINIKDDGKGIKENLDKIFDRFYKGENGNFGLGLAIVKESINLMNGNIKAYNDGGLCFEITLPLNCH